MPDTAWNLHFLEQFDAELYRVRIALGTAFLLAQRNARGLWGRSKRDIERIPVTGLLLYLFPQLATRETMRQLELLWVSERNGLTYKAAYTLLSFKRNNYEPNDPLLIESTVNWLVDNQRDNGGFAPWKAHPVASDVYCTAVAALGLLQYRELVPRRAFERCLQWLESSQLPQGIWAFHEIEDGASWGLWALIELSTFLAVE